MTDIRQIIADAIGIEAADIPADAGMESVEAWESVTHLSVILALESQLGVKFTLDEVGELTSIPAIEAAVARKKG